MSYIENLTLTQYPIKSIQYKEVGSLMKVVTGVVGNDVHVVANRLIDISLGEMIKHLVKYIIPSLYSGETDKKTLKKEVLAHV